MSKGIYITQTFKAPSAEGASEAVNIFLKDRKGELKVVSSNLVAFSDKTSISLMTFFIYLIYQEID